MKSSLAWAAGLVGLLLLVAVVAFERGKSVTTASITYQARVDTVRMVDSARHAAAETVTVRLRAQATVDTLVRVVSDTQLVVSHDTIVAPAQVVERIVTDDRTIVALTAQVRADSSDIRALKLLLATPKPARRWGLAVSGGYGPQAEHDGAIRLGWSAHLGLSYRLF